MNHDLYSQIRKRQKALMDSLAVPVLLSHEEAIKLVVADLTAKYHFNKKRGDTEWIPVFEKILSYYLSPEELEKLTK